MATNNPPGNIEVLNSHTETLTTILTSTRSIYINIGNRYHDLNPSLHNNPLIHLSQRDLIAAELCASPALPLSVRQGIDAARLMTLFEHTAAKIECSVVFVAGMAEAGEATDAADVVVATAVLHRARALCTKAHDQLRELWVAVSAHESLGRWLRSRGLYDEEQTRKTKARGPEKWAARVEEWVVEDE